MQNFEFYNPVKIIFGKDQLYKIRKYINANQRILIIYGGGSIKRNGVYEAVKAALADYKVTEFAGIEANPRYETCMKVVEQIKAEKVGFLLAVGGGSVIDATKFIALAALHTEGDPWEIVCGTARATQSPIRFGTHSAGNRIRNEQRFGHYTRGDSRKTRLRHTVFVSTFFVPSTRCSRHFA